MGKSAKKKNGTKHLTRAQKLDVLLKTAVMGEKDLGAYLRKSGLHSSDLDHWKQELSSDHKTEMRENRAEISALKKEIKKQKSEIRRKERALAEASAILVMKKKAELIWGVVDEDDKSE